MLTEKSELEAALGSEDSLEPPANAKRRSSCQARGPGESDSLRGKLAAGEPLGRELLEPWFQRDPELAQGWPSGLPPGRLCFRLEGPFCLYTYGGAHPSLAV